jgi:hypothetical protein
MILTSVAFTLDNNEKLLATSEKVLFLLTARLDNPASDSTAWQHSLSHKQVSQEVNAKRALRAWEVHQSRLDPHTEVAVAKSTVCTVDRSA